MKTLAPSLLCAAFTLFGCEKNKVQQDKPAAAYEQPVTTLPPAQPPLPVCPVLLGKKRSPAMPDSSRSC